MTTSLQVPDRVRRLRINRELFVFLAYLLLASLEAGIGADLGARCYGGGASDPGQDIYVLHWVATHFWSPRAIFEGPTFYPSHESILYCDPLLAPAVLVQPLRLFTDNPVLLYNSAILLSLATAAYGFYRLALSLFSDPAAAFLAGIVIPFTAHQTGQLWHLNLLTISGFPFLILSFIRLLDKPHFAWAMGLGAAFGLQAGTSGYHAFSCLFFSFLLALWGWRRFRRPATWGHFLIAAAIAIVILLPYVVGFEYLKTHEAGLGRSDSEQARYSIDFPRSLLVSHAYVWRWCSWAQGFVPFFPGLTVIYLAALGALQIRKEPHVRLLIGVGLFFLLLALGPQIRVLGYACGPGLFWWLEGWVPLLSSVRHPLTFAVPSLMALGLLACAGFQASGLSRSKAASAVILAAALETLAPHPYRSEAPRVLPPVYQFLRSQPKGAFLEVSRPAGKERDPLDPGRARWWAIFHGLPVVNGAGAFEPEHYTDLSQRVKREWRRTPPGDLAESRSVAALKTYFPIRYLVVHNDAEKAVRENVEATREAFELISELPDGDRVYRVHRGGIGHFMTRVFREDQLAGGWVKATMRGTAGKSVTISIGDMELTRAVLTDAWEEIVCPVPHSLVRRGSNEINFEGTEDAVVELRDVEASY
jgi:hypothetical protein